MTSEAILSVDSPAAKERWASIAVEARRRRLGIEIRDGTTERPYRVIGKERTGVDVQVGDFGDLVEAFREAEGWVLDRPIPGPVALRDELRDHGRKLAILTPREVSRRAGDWPLYRRFRDRILPLAFDNLVNSVRLEALEEAGRAAVAAYDQRGNTKARTSDLAAAIATLRGLVEPKEEVAEGAGETES